MTSVQNTPILFHKYTALRVLCLIVGFITSQAMAEQYKYQTLDSQGVTHWTVTTPQNKHPKDKTLEVHFADLKIEKLTVTTPLKPKLQNPKVIAIVGDTGCRLKEGSVFSSYQDCNDPEAWPYPKVIESVQQAKPDLIIHVGDFHYREQCSPGKPCQKMSPSVGYEWAPWQLDFFEPSRKALASAPWLMARGNHEDCNRAFLGYKKLLVAKDWSQECLDFEEPQVVELGDLAIVNLDSSGISDFPEVSDQTTVLWKKRLEAIDQKLKNTKARHIWVITHKPIYGLVKLGQAYAPTNINLKKYFETASWSSKVELILSGHVHNTQLTTAAGSPLQVVLGNGGTTLESENPTLTAANLSAIGYNQGKVLDRKFGYVLIRQGEGSKYTLEFHLKEGNTLYSCHLENKGQDCF